MNKLKSSHTKEDSICLILGLEINESEMKIKPELKNQVLDYIGLLSFLKHHWNSVKCLYVCLFPPCVVYRV